MVEKRADVKRTDDKLRFRTRIKFNVTSKKKKHDREMTSEGRWMQRGPRTNED